MSITDGNEPTVKKLTQEEVAAKWLKRAWHVWDWLNDAGQKEEIKKMLRELDAAKPGVKGRKS